MNGRPIRSRTSPESVVQIRPPASLRKVRTDSGFTNSLAIVRSVSSSRPSPSYTRMNSPRRKAASARSSATNSEELGGVYQDCCRNQFIGPHWEGRRPYFGRSHGAHDVGAAGDRASRSGGNAGHHRVPPGPNLRGVAIEREGSFPRGRSAAHFPGRNGRENALRFVHGEMTLRARSQRDRKSTRLNSSHGSSSYAVFCSTKK